MPWALCLAPLAGTAALAAILLMGPTTLASLTPQWVLAFLAALVATVFWWAGYLWLLNRLAGWPWRRGLADSVPHLLMLSVSLLLALVVFLSGKLFYTLTFDAPLQSLYRWLGGAILGATLAAQELTLLAAVRRESPHRTVAAGWRMAARLPGRLVRLPGVALHQIRAHPIPAAILAALLLVGIAQRWADIDRAHPGDMDVILSAVYGTLHWPPFGYYHAYRPQTWVYNHLPLFPMLLAPFYWLFENLLHLPTAWAAKMLIGLTDLVVAVLLHGQVPGRRLFPWGLAVAAAWLLAPWVIGGDDHPIALAIAFTLAACASLQRGWLCGLLLALGMATRNEVAFFVLPLALHFAARRGLPQTVAFLGAFGTTLALVAAPFVLTDPEALDYALRRQLQRDASTQMSALGAALLPHLDAATATLLQQNPSLLALGLNLLIAPLALRDRRAAGVVLVAALGYLLTLPVMHERYTLFAYALGLFYAARHRDPIVGALTLAMTWPGAPYGLQILIGLFAGLVLRGLRVRG